MRNVIAAVGVVMSLGSAALGQVVRIDEAEACKVTCTHKEMGETIWASGGKLTPPFWGFEPGESIEWTVSFKTPQDGLKLAVRYSYAAQAYRDFHHIENPDRVLHLCVDGKEPFIRVPVPDTGWWDIFETSHVNLPKLAAGDHTFKLFSPAKHETSNVDCMILYRGAPDKIPANLRSTIVRLTPTSMPTTAPTSKRFVIRVTPKAVMKMKPEIILKQFDRIWEYYEKYMGWTPPAPVGINIIEDAKWPNPGSTAFQNGYGVFFRAGVMNTEQGNWCHEMTHMFYVAHFPGWFDESSVTTLTVFNWVPALFAKTARPQDDPTYRAWEKDARRFLDTPAETTGNMVLIQDAIRVKYGPEVFGKFFHACVEAGKKEELDFTPGRHLNKAEIVKYMSQAAGEDVTPIYRRWTGFDGTP